MAIITELKGKDLFTMDQDKYVLAHCISSDFYMGGGIAYLFTKKGVKAKLFEDHPNFYNEFSGEGDCIYTETPSQDGWDVMRTYNLITKKDVVNKPTYQSLKESLVKLRNMLVENNHKDLAIPKIGCGIDGLDWDVVKHIISDVFERTNVNIFVCVL